jgi:Transcriptional Coactivator p15 (PC4)
MAGLEQPIEISKFWANRRGEAVIVSLREFGKGVLIVDVRKHYSAADGTLKPTAKGIALTVRKLPELTVAIGKALKRAHELGLLGSQS